MSFGLACLNLYALEIGYKNKKSETHSDRPEYWIADPQAEVVIVLWLDVGTYVEVVRFQGIERIVPERFPELALTAEQVLRPEF